MTILLSISLILIVAGCASYHDGNRKGIFLKNDAPGTGVYAEGKIDADIKEKLNSKMKDKAVGKIAKRHLKDPCY
jgi:hypothetical protein